MSGVPGVYLQAVAIQLAHTQIQLAAIFAKQNAEQQQAMGDLLEAAAANGARLAAAPAPGTGTRLDIKA